MKGKQRMKPNPDESKKEAESRRSSAGLPMRANPTPNKIKRALGTQQN
jgi:hypothetical protein